MEYILGVAIHSYYSEYSSTPSPVMYSGMIFYVSWYFISFKANLTASKETESFARPRYSHNIFVFVGGSFAGDDSIILTLFSFYSLSKDED